MDARMDPKWEKRLTDAVEEDNVRNVEELLQQTPMNLTSPDSRNNLLMKAKCVEILKVLLQNQWIRQSINDGAGERKTALSEQILKSSNEADCLSRVQLFITSGACLRTMLFGPRNDALCTIISNEWKYLFNYIVDHIDDINSVNVKGKNILHVILSDNKDYVVKDNILYFVKNVVERGLDIRSEDKKNGNTPLILSCEAGYFDVFKYLHRREADVNLVNKQGQAPLQIACRKGRKELVEYLIQNGGSDVNKVDNNGETALMEACTEGHKEIVEYLIQHGDADVNVADEYGRTALMMACTKGNKEIVEYLIQHSLVHDINMVNNYGEITFMLACIFGHKEIVEYLIKHRVIDVNKANRYGRTAFIVACGGGHKEIVEYLIQHGGAEVDKVDNEGETALMIACRKGHKETVEYLVQHGGADVTTVNNDGETALMLACRKGHKETVEYGRHRGYDGYTLNRHGRPDLMEVCTEGHKEIVEYLIQHGGSDVNQVNNDGETALRLACREGHIEIANDLIQHGRADVNISDKKGKTVIGYLVEQQRRHPVYKRHLGCKRHPMYERHLEYKRHQMEDLPLFKLLVESGADLTSNGVKLIQDILNKKLKEWFLCLIGVKPHIGGLTAEGENIFHLLARLNLNSTLDNFDWLLDYKVDINHKNSNTDSPLMIAAVLLNVKYLKVFTQHPAVDINIQNNNGHTALHCLILGFTKFFQRIPKRQGDDYIQYLCQHLYPSYMECVDSLLGAGIDVNTQDNEGKTVLMMAARENDKQLIKKLLDAGAMVDKVDSSGRYALHYLDISAHQRHPLYKHHLMKILPLFKLFVESGADLTSIGVELIQDVLNEKLTDWFLYLIGEKPHIGGLTAEGENILHLLARLNLNSTLDNCDWLHDYKVDINHKNTNTDSPLMIAAVLLNVKYLKVFTHHPAVELNIQNNNGHTALHCLILGFTKFFQRIPPSQGDNYIQFLCQHLYPSYMECVDILLGAGIDVNIQDNEGKTVLMMAARENDKQLISKLLDAGAMVDKVDSSGRYALHYLDISDSVYDLTVFLLLLPTGRDSLIDVPCIHGNTFLQTVLQFPRLWNPCNVVSFVRWLIYRNCSLQHLRAEKGQSAYNDLSLDEFSPSERQELRRLLYLSGAPQEEIIAVVNCEVEDEAEDKFDSRIKFETLCLNLQFKCIRFFRQLFGTGINEKLSELGISLNDLGCYYSPLLQDIIAVSTRIKEEQKRIPDELMRLLLLDNDASDNNSLRCKCIRVIKQLLETRVKDKIVRLQLPENILLGEFNYVDDESEYCAYTVDKYRETEGRKYEYKVNMMFYHDDDDDEDD